MNDIDMTDADCFILDGFSSENRTPRPNQFITRDANQGLNDHGMHNSSGDLDQRRFVVAVDFGTTFSTVAYVCLDGNTDRTSIRAQDIKCIADYPDLPGGPASASAMSGYENVPTEIWYREDTSIGSGFEGDWATPELPPGADALDSSDEESHNSDTSEISGQMKRPVQHDELQNRLDKRMTPCDLVWGYGVHKGIEDVDRLGDSRRRLARFKLMLDSDSEHTRELRETLSQSGKFLKNQGLISTTDQIISDYLEKLLRHTKTKLIEIENLRPHSPVEFVITVPNIWSVGANIVMHDAMASAIERSGLGKLEKGSIDNLYLISEPEAAAEFVVDDPEHKIQVRPGETILILDAGGGTVDAAMYCVTGTVPLRLEREAVELGGALCGSSFLNEEYRKALRRRLKGVEDHVSPDGVPFENELNSLVIAWEHGGKRTTDVNDQRIVEYSDYIRGLDRDASKGFAKNRIYWKRDEMKKIFWPCLKGVQDLLKTQLELAATRKIDVSKVVLVGGFAASDSLYHYLRKFLTKERSFTNAKIELKRPKAYTTSAVGRGAVLRALRKGHGPRRISRSSLGFLRTEPFDPKEIEAHKGVKPRYDPVDGQKWIDNTIYWVIQKVSGLFSRLLHRCLTIAS